MIDIGQIQLYQLQYIDQLLDQITTMFFNRYQRIKTEPRIQGHFDEEFKDNKVKLKIKSIRFSFDQQMDKIPKQAQKSRQIEQKDMKEERQVGLHAKRFSFMQKLPQLNLENKQGEKEQFREKKQWSMHHYRKKDALLNSILQILKPSSAYPLENVRKEAKERKQLQLEKEWRRQPVSRQYVNEFFQEMPQQSTTKYHRAPKIIENELFKFKNSKNIVRRKIFSEDKDRQKMERQKVVEDCKQSSDLQKIQIVTFANKFPMSKKEVDSLK